MTSPGPFLVADLHFVSGGVKVSFARAVLQAWASLNCTPCGFAPIFQTIVSPTPTCTCSGSHLFPTVPVMGISTGAGGAAAFGAGCAAMFGPAPAMSPIGTSSAASTTAQGAAEPLRLRWYLIISSSSSSCETSPAALSRGVGSASVMGKGRDRRRHLDDRHHPAVLM